MSAGCWATFVDAVSSSDTEDEITVGQDPSRPCTTAWCHELACQNTHFAVGVQSLAAYVRHHAPTPWVRIQLWVPNEGPRALDLDRTASDQVLEASLRAAGHEDIHRILHVAFDTRGTTLELLSVPPGNTVWWIVRDGVSRELLRPVMPWYDGNNRLVATLNSHGQAVSVAPSPEVDGLIRLPQGVRATMAVPLSPVHGYVTLAGLVLTEASIGTAASRARRSMSAFLWALWLCVGAHGMQTQQISVARSQVGWGTVMEAPRITHIWTHSLAAPVVVPYTARPDPALLARAVAETSRGVGHDGIFDWTLPSQLHDSGHVIHYPSGVSPPYLFWLLHYRGRGSVVAAAPGHIDWPMLAREAGEAFGVDGLLRGQFGLQHNGRIYAYGTTLATPPHGTILHVVRTGEVTASSSASPWESPPDMPWIPQFDYALCRGPRGEEALVAGRASPAGLYELRSVTDRLQDLTLRCETALANILELCSAPAGESAPAARETPEPTGAEQSHASDPAGCPRPRPGLGLLVFLAGWASPRAAWIVLLLAFSESPVASLSVKSFPPWFIPHNILSRSVAGLLR